MSKCVGCGVGSAKKYCYRCFRLKHYGQILAADVTKEEVLKTLAKINNDEHVLLLVDIMDIPKDFKMFERFNNITLVLTKRDQLPSKIDDQKLMTYFKQQGFKRTMVVSAQKNYNMDVLYKEIQKHRRNYFIGFVNAGKSTLINKLLYNYFYTDGKLLTSVTPSTTRALVTIDATQNLQLIDTPGIIDEKNIIHHLAHDELKKLKQEKVINPVIYQIKKDQTIIVNNQFSFFVRQPNVLVFYFKNAHFHRHYQTVDLKQKITISEKKEIVIPGLGFISVQKAGEIFYDIPTYATIFTRKPLI